ncbi:MAG: DUF1700 domain-containing protein [Oscillospiraceae bacterium]|jgi:uncharacterized membrane protein|nr:DUF1700 domain-containing protein [Oscillospiraceae bacterium]
MNKQQFLKELEYQLRRMPQEERDDAVRYYDEFISDAENEAEAIKGIGSPANAAANIIAEWGALAAAESTGETGGKNQRTSSGEEKKKGSAFKTFWIVLLAVFASPIALPIAFAIAAVVFAIVIALAAVVAVIAAAAVVLVLSVPVALVMGIAAFPVNPLSACMGIGFALAAFGTGVLLIKAVKIIAKYGFGGLARWLSGIIKRGGKK